MPNPYESPTIAADPRPACRGGGLLDILRTLTHIYPLAMIGFIYLSWLLAWAELGHPPRPILDDPTSISILVSIAGLIGMLLVIAFPLGFFGGATLQLVAPNATQSERIVRCLLLFALWVAVFIFLRWDPFGVVYWIMD